MTTLPNSGSALVVVDAQRVILEGCLDPLDKTRKIGEAISWARDNQIPIVWIQHSDDGILRGSDGWQLVDGLVPSNSEIIVEKHFRSSFADTNLHEVLQDLGVGQIYVCGAESNICIRHTIHSAIEIGYDVILLRDAHTAASIEWDGLVVDAQRVIDEMNFNFLDYRLPGRRVTAKFVSDLKA
jgi:nicotinamidase-related amidase